MLCNDCFHASDHVGHEVFFFYSNTQGCCDCGDPSAWDPRGAARLRGSALTGRAGFCSKHGRREDHNPVDDLEPGLAQCARVVIGSVGAELQRRLAAPADGQQLMDGLLLWLIRAAQAADGLARLVISAMELGEPSLLTLMVSEQPRLSSTVVALSDKLMLQLLVDSEFKKIFGRVYAAQYQLLAKNNSANLFLFSVQFLNRETHIRQLVTQHGLLGSIVAVLKDQLPPSLALDEAGALPETKSYTPVIKDLKYCFSHPTFSLAIVQQPELAAEIRELVGLLAHLRWLHLQTRAVDQHVVYESSEWMTAFNLGLTLSSTLDKLVCSVTTCIRSFDGEAQVLTAAEQLLDVFFRPTAAMLGQPAPTCLHANHRWQCATLEPYNVASQPATFHNLAERFIASILATLCSIDVHGSRAVKAVLESELTEPLALRLMEAPIRTFVLAAQIRTGMWVRNGSTIRDQLLNYNRWPLCLNFVDKDRLAVQFAAAAVSPAALLSTLVARFGLEAWIDQPETPEPHQAALAVELVRLVVQLVTELPPPAAALHGGVKLKRELIHTLACKDSTHSELSAFCELESCSGYEEARLDQLLQEVQPLVFGLWLRA